MHFGSYLDKDRYVYFQNTLIHTYIKEEGTSVSVEYFYFEKLGGMKKLGISQIQLSESMVIIDLIIKLGRGEIFFFLI
jgi:hypothetical protein